MSNINVSELLKEGGSVMSELGKANSDYVVARIGWREIVGRPTIVAEEARLNLILEKMRPYMGRNLTEQSRLAEHAADDSSAIAHLTVLQSQKSTVETMVVTVISTITSHRSEVDSKTGHVLMAIASFLALGSVLVSLVTIVSN